MNKIITLCFLLFASTFIVQQSSLEAQQADEAYHARMKWWDAGRLGMFLHWGVYSTFGGEYKGMDHGKEMGQASAEWLYLKANVPQEEYREAAARFNPVDFNAVEWVKMAKDAGMKYMVLTSKHHDGFALFDTKASDWNAVKASGIKKDLIREYVDACHAQNMRVGFYYSHEKDWFHHSRTNKDSRPLPESYKELVRKQVRELFTQYGRIDLIWFDTPVAEHEAFNRECAAIVRELQPECIINGRIGNNLGDYKNIGDRAIVDPGLAGYMESIMTMRLNWGFDRNDDFWKSSGELIDMVSKSACRGSNFLLNIGPTPEGTFPPEDQVRLHDMGKWIKKNGEAIYGTSGSPFSREHRWGSITVKKKTNSVYLHLWNWPGGPIVLHGLESDVKEASFLDSGEKVSTHRDQFTAELMLDLPNENHSDQVRIIELNLAEDVRFDLDKGPDYNTRPVHHVTRQRIFGTITSIDGISFSLKGRQMISPQGSYWELAGEETEKTFILNDHVRYRINHNGDIRQVQGYGLETGGEYAVVYSPYKEGPELDIITELR